MCRYMFDVYACRWACFDCRKAFKGHGVGEMGKMHGDTFKCPQCAKPMADLGQDFKPPRKHSSKQWSKVELLYKHKGITYHSCGCDGPGYRPKTLAQAKTWKLGWRDR